MNGENENSGFLERNQLFRKNYNLENDYRPEGATFFGRLLLDLSSASCGLPPSCKVKIELDRASDEFVLLSQAHDNERYKVKILNIALYVPVAQLSQTVYNQISTLHAKQDVAIHYRRLEVRPFSLNRNSEEYNSNNLFVEEIPCRIIICFVETSNKNGKYHSSPFNLVIDILFYTLLFFVYFINYIFTHLAPVLESSQRGNSYRPSHFSKRTAS